MKRFLLLFTFVPLLCSLSACSAGKETSGVLTGVIFERGHGSAWGNQFYIHVSQQEILSLRYVSKATGNMETRTHISITQQQWQQIEAAVQAMELQVEKPSVRGRLLGSSRLDGTEYRKLSLVTQVGDEQVETAYQWPQSSQAAALEALFEQFIPTDGNEVTEASP